MKIILTHKPRTKQANISHSSAKFVSKVSIFDVEKYMSEYRILSVRQRVLSNELQDIQGQIMQVMGDMRSSFSFVPLWIDFNAGWEASPEWGNC